MSRYLNDHVKNELRELFAPALRVLTEYASGHLADRKRTPTRRNKKRPARARDRAARAARKRNRSHR